MPTPPTRREELFKPKAAYDIPTPFDPAELKRTEKQLGAKLPVAFVELLKVRNGGSLRLTKFNLKTKPPRGIGWISGRTYHLAELPGIHRTHPNGLTQLAETGREWNVEQGLVPLAGEGHYWLCLDYRKSGPRGNPSITHWEQSDPGKPGETFRVADSFADFIAGLRRGDEDYEDAAIALDRPAVRDAKLAKILTSLGCKRHVFKGAMRSRHPRPKTWTWNRYKSFVKGMPVWIQLAKNKMPEQPAQFDRRPVGHPILRVRVRPSDEKACIGELMEALGRDAKLLQGVV